MTKTKKTKKKETEEDVCLCPIPYGVNLDLLKARAISSMAFARPRRSQLPVGCAIIDTKKTIFTGANIETLWQRSYHAEETAFMYAATHDAGKILAVCVAAERRLFTPCGGCIDLLIEFCRDDAIVVHVNPKTHHTTILPLSGMMPYYPTKV